MQCEALDVFPGRGVRRDDLLPDLRLIGFRRRATIAFVVEPDRVVILGIFYGGRDVEGWFAEQGDAA